MVETNKTQTLRATLDEFMLIKTLGVGRTAKIELATNPKGNQFALKIFKLGHPLTNQRTMELMDKEVVAKRELNHQNISKYHGLNENSILKNADGTETQVAYIIEEPILGGELFDHVMEKGGFTENMCDVCVFTQKILVEVLSHGD